MDEITAVKLQSSMHHVNPCPILPLDVRAIAAAERRGPHSIHSQYKQIRLCDVCDVDPVGSSREGPYSPGIELAVSALRAYKTLQVVPVATFS